MPVPTQRDAQAFVEIFAEGWTLHEPERFLPLFHPGGRFSWPVMKEPVPVTKLVETGSGFLTVVPELQLRVNGWCASPDAIFIEWTIHSAIAGHRPAVPGGDRFTVEGDKAVEMWPYSDTRPLLRALGFDAPEDLLGMLPGSEAGP